MASREVLRPNVFLSLLPPLAVLLILGVRSSVRRPLLPDQGRVVGTPPAEGFGGGQHWAFPQARSNTRHSEYHKRRPRPTTSPAPRSDPQYTRFSSPFSYPLSPTDTLVDVACHYRVTIVSPTIPATSERCQHYIWPFNELLPLLGLHSLCGLRDSRSHGTSLLRSSRKARQPSMPTVCNFSVRLGSWPGRDTRLILTQDQLKNAPCISQEPSSVSRTRILGSDCV